MKSSSEHNSQVDTDHMHHVKLPHLSQELCEQTLGRLARGMICAGHMAGGKDSCKVCFPVVPISNIVTNLKKINQENDDTNINHLVFKFQEYPVQNGGW